MNDQLEAVLGNLYKLVCDESIDEVSIGAYHDVSVKKNDSWHPVQCFNSKDEYESVINALKDRFSITKDQVSFSRYITEVLTASVVLSPISIKGPSLKLTKLPKKILSLEDYVSLNALTEKGKDIITEIVGSNKGILCAGDFGSGKTTLYNTILNLLPKEKTLVSIETTPSIVFYRNLVTRLMPRGKDADSITEVMSAAEESRGDYITLSYLDERLSYPYIDLVRNNSVGVACAGGSGPVNVIDRLIRQSVVSSYGYNLEEAALVVSEVFKYIIFQEKESGSERRFISSIHEIAFEKGEIKLKPLYAS
ncbi:MULTISPECIES: ATPase, T2SS/T4P/T4SS family [unclassified Halobacteriovorax]|uniref:ATPase, T2SS/T4P/T4SS family n=1 Tax=unclassified Halobacteriovorax TaxID=2639665 RepID=UPI003999F1BB